jgi:ABC-2 type transport system ATP-binding protein
MLRMPTRLNLKGVGRLELGRIEANGQIMMMHPGVAIRVENVYKTFVLPHEKINTMKGLFVNLLKRKTYEKFIALEDVSLEVRRGEFLGIIGRNGSGKSTLLKILAGIYRADSGQVRIDGRISPFLELGIGFHPDLSGRDNVYLNGSVLGLRRKDIDRLFDAIVEFSELERFIDQKIKNYSSGMQVRLAFSIAIHANREILLMDEVLAVGDSNFQTKCIREFNRYREVGKTVILVTHDIVTMQKYCDRALLLRDGKIQIEGAVEEVANRYVEQNLSDQQTAVAQGT